MHGRSPAEPADVVLAPDAGRADGLMEALTAAAHLRPGGLVVLRTRCDAASDVLVQRGFHVERRLRGRHRDVYIARRRASYCRDIAEATSARSAA